MATSQEADSDMECSDNEDGYEDYNDYYNDEDSDIERIDPTKVDPEYFDYKCLSEEEVERLLNETVESLSNRLIISPSLAKVSDKSLNCLGIISKKPLQVLLHSQHWNTNEVIHKYKENPQQTLIGARINPPSPPKSILFTSTYLACSVCITTQNIDKFFHLSCAHIFCRECWTTHFEVQISQVIITA